MNPIKEVKEDAPIPKAMKRILPPLLSLAAGGTALYSLYPDLLVRSGFLALRWWAGLKRTEVKVDDHLWVFLDGGGRGDPLLFIHGFGADKDRWGGFLSAFCRDHRIIAPDLPGFGESSRIASAGYDIPSQAKRLNRFVEKLALHSFHLVGISMGGYIGAYFASEYPEKLKSLTLMDAAGVKSRVASDFLRQYEDGGKVALLYRNLKEYDDLISMLFFRPPWVPKRIKAYLAKDGIERHDFHQKILEEVGANGAALLEGRLGRISVPTLVVWGANDRILDVSSVEKFEKELRDSRTVIIDRCGHVPYVERPRETKRACKEFLRRIS